ncbi:DUF6090 family protein [Balneola sp. MJW-20]|uniref:DUF6090 family protein n=1 Tax=Gracilimonas aurantiaca TaxID=3234185 RepID=UPI00346654F8
MLRFFQHIRQSLIKTDNVRRYLLYAIGEILLVGIGILLALQVNIWNEERKDQLFLDFALSELYEDLSRDMELIYSGIEPRLQSREESVEKVFQIVLSGREFSEDEFVESYLLSDRGFNFTPIFGSYETLTQKGMDKLEDKELRKLIIDFYEYYLPRAVDFIHREDAERKWYTREMESEFLERYLIDSEDNSPEINVRLKDTDILKSQALLELLDMHADDTEHKRRRLEAIKRRYYTLMDKMEAELKARNVAYVAFDPANVIPDF